MGLGREKGGKLKEKVNRMARDVKQTEMPLGVKFKPPTLAEVHGECVRLGMPWTEAERFHSYFESNDWHVGRVKMKSWRAALNHWRLNMKPDRAKTVFELTKIIEANQKIADQIKRANIVEVATGRRWTSEIARAKYKDIIEHIKELNEQLAGM